MISDAHCHFLSEGFFAALAHQRGRGEAGTDLTRELGWEAPGPAERLADRWVRELDAHGVSRAALIASVPRDEALVAEAVAHHPTRLVGFFMVDPSAADAVERTHRGLSELGLRAVCLFPAMHQVRLDDPRVYRILEATSSHPGAAVFVHCGMLSVGARQKLGLPSRFDLRLGQPLEVQPLAMAYPHVPFIVPHFGAGFFREALMAAEACANIHLDTSSSNRWIRYTPGLTLDGVFRTAIEVLGSSRLLFGTDSSFFPRGWQKAVYEQQKAVLDALQIAAGDQAAIFGGNFDRLLASGPDGNHDPVP
ncbi:MAG: amidohydrolase family protein [Vicinamibacterales bacterium]